MTPRRFVVLQGGRSSLQHATTAARLSQRVRLKLTAILLQKLGLARRPQLQLIKPAAPPRRAAHSVRESAVDCCGL